MHVKIAFLYGNLEETIYTKQPKGFEVGDKKDYVCKLKRSLYGLKQSPRQLNKPFNAFIARIGFECSKYDVCVYFKFLEQKVIS